MKLTIGIVIASILIIGLVDFSDATFLPWPPVTCEPPTKAPKPTKTPKPPTRPPTRPPPTRPPTRPPTPPPTRPPTRPPTPPPTLPPTIPTPTHTPPTRPPTNSPPTVPPTLPTRPPPNPCHVCGPGGVPCQGCPNQDGLCEELVRLVRQLENQVLKCVCGQKFV